MGFDASGDAIEDVPLPSIKVGLGRGLQGPWSVQNLKLHKALPAEDPATHLAAAVHSFTSIAGAPADG